MDDEKKTVLMITPWNRNGGLATYARYLHENLSELCDISVHQWDYESFVRRGSGIEVLSVDLIKKMYDSDNIHIQYTFGRYILSLPVLIILSKLLGCKIILTQHERFDNLPLQNLLWLYHQFLYILIDTIIVHTKHRKSMVSSMHSNKIEVISHGIINRPNIEQSPRDIRSIVIPGMIRPIKGYEHAIESLQYLEETDIQIVGKISDEEYYNTLVNKAEGLGVQHRVKWETGFLSEEKLFEIIRDADLLLLPYNQNTSMSGILAHCISWKNITVVSDAPALQEVVQCNNAIVQQDGRMIAETIKEIKSSEVVQKDILEFISNLSDSYSWEKVANNTRGVYI